MAGGSSSKKKKSWRKWKDKQERKPNPATQLTNDLLVEILSRVPYRSLCRFPCVSTRWRALISHPDYQSKLPQTLFGIFHRKPHRLQSRQLLRIDAGWLWLRQRIRNRPSAHRPFLPNRVWEHLYLMDTCNGLVLCRGYRYSNEDEFDYIVLNPVTKKRVVVLVSWRWSYKVQMVRLGFDPACSPHFHIFEFQLDWDDEDDDAGDGHVLGVKMYSFETGVWCHKQSDWSFEIIPFYDFKSVFANSVLYVISTGCLIGAVDVKGEIWRVIDFPPCKDSEFEDTGPGFIDLSQGQLHFANDDDMVGDKLAIWVLEDKDSDE